MSLSEQPHRRRNALTGDWVLVSPQRLQRPWQGAQEPAPRDRPPSYDPNCYLCPGNVRAGGRRNPDYRGPYVFTNDFPALLPEASGATGAGHPLLRSEAVRGTCRVLCYSPDHGRGLAALDDAERLAVVEAWCAQSAELRRAYRWVQPFENRGEMMGCSSPHPHGQVWALDRLPTVAAREAEQQRRHWRRHGRALLLDYLDLEAADGARLVTANAHWVVLVPYWAAWPFETLLLPRRAVAQLEDLDDEARAALAEILGRLLAAYDALFDCPFPYSMGWHGAPGGGRAAPGWQLHAHFYPPLLRSATVRKHMVGFELLAEVQRDLTPEAAAARLREVLG
ncbi:MAG: galactose-1-phosphate uridylyltransferase [Gammaproteobacteria bacterium]|nr:MAG: galactose-1-phosphate uridylyltransferase [Gammaproteobacteria bacterium]